MARLDDKIQFENIKYFSKGNHDECKVVFIDRLIDHCAIFKYMYPAPRQTHNIACHNFYAHSTLLQIRTEMCVSLTMQNHPRKPRI